MANEISLSVALSFTKGAKSADRAKSALLRDMTGADYIERNQIIGASAEALDIGEMTTPGLSLMANLDATDSIHIRIGSGGTNVVTLKPGDWQLFRLAGATPHAISSANTPELYYMILEE